MKIEINNISCEGCGKTNFKIHRRYKDKVYCSSCYNIWFPKRQCSECNSISRIFLGDTPAVCLSCLKKRPCIRCGKIGYKIGKLTKYGVACNSCAIYFTQPRPCFECGKLTYKLSRSSLANHNNLLCSSCYSRYKYATCKSCHRYRVIYNLNTQQCKKCSTLGIIKCKKCGQDMAAGYGKVCTECYKKDLINRRMTININLLENDIVKTKYCDFIEWYSNQVSLKTCINKINIHIEFFIICDENWGKIPNYQTLFSKMPTNNMRNNSPILKWLIATKQISINADVKTYNAEKERINILLLKPQNKSIKCINNYYNYLLSKHHSHEICITSIRLALQPAVDLAIISNLSSLELPTQTNLDKYLSQKPGQISSISGFIHFLNLHYNYSLKINYPKISKKNTELLCSRLVSLFYQENLKQRDKNELLKLALFCLHHIKLAKVSINKIAKDRHNNYCYVYKAKHYYIPLDIYSLLCK